MFYRCSAGGSRCRRRSFHKVWLVLEGRFNELIDQIVREIGSPIAKPKFLTVGSPSPGRGGSLPRSWRG